MHIPKLVRSSLSNPVKQLRARERRNLVIVVEGGSAILRYCVSRLLPPTLLLVACLTNCLPPSPRRRGRGGSRQAAAPAPGWLAQPRMEVQRSSKSSQWAARVERGNTAHEKIAQGLGSGLIQLIWLNYVRRVSLLSQPIL